MLKRKNLTLRQRVLREYKKAYREEFNHIYERKDLSGVEGKLLKYYREQQRELKRFKKFSEEKEMWNDVQKSDIVYVGDFHPLYGVKLNFCDIIENTTDDRKTIIALEEFLKEEQHLLDGFAKGEISKKEVKRFIERKPNNTSPSGIVKILTYARKKGIIVRGIDTYKKNPKSRILSARLRDDFFAKQLTEIYTKNDFPRIFVLAGDIHVARCHLPKKTKKQLKETIKDLVIFQNEEQIFWQLMSLGKEHIVPLVKLYNGDYCINHTPPLLKELVFQNIHTPQEERDDTTGLLLQYIRVTQRIITQSLGIYETNIPIDLVTFHDDKKIESLLLEYQEEERIVKEDIPFIMAASAEGRSCSLIHNRKAIIYLASDEMEHIAEEIAHITQPIQLLPQRTLFNEPIKEMIQHFYSQIIEEAIGYIGSKMMVPTRQPFDIEEIDLKRHPLLFDFIKNHHCIEKTGKINSMEKMFSETLEKVLTYSDFLTHYFGGHLGEKIYNLNEKGNLSVTEIRTLFKRNFKYQNNAIQEYFRIITLETN